MTPARQPMRVDWWDDSMRTYPQSRRFEQCRWLLVALENSLVSPLHLGGRIGMHHRKPRFAVNTRNCRRSRVLQGLVAVHGGWPCLPSRAIFAGFCQHPTRQHSALIRAGAQFRSRPEAQHRHREQTGLRLRRSHQASTPNERATLSRRHSKRAA